MVKLLMFAEQPESEKTFTCANPLSERLAVTAEAVVVGFPKASTIFKLRGLHELTDSAALPVIERPAATAPRTVTD